MGKVTGHGGYPHRYVHSGISGLENSLCSPSSDGELLEYAYGPARSSGT